MSKDRTIRDQFIHRILRCDCDHCPIKTYCSMCVAISCASTAKQYYESHQKGGVFVWPVTAEEEPQEQS